MPRDFFKTATVLGICALLTAGWSQVPAPGNTKPPIPKKSPLAPYAGTWTGTSLGRIFVTLRLAQGDDQLSGSIEHPRRIDTDDAGDVKNFSDDFSTAVVVDAKLTGDGVLLTVKEGGDNEVSRFSMRLTGETTATLKMLAMEMPPGMAKPRPWKLTKAGATASPPNPTSQR